MAQIYGLLLSLQIMVWIGDMPKLNLYFRVFDLHTIWVSMLPAEQLEKHERKSSLHESSQFEQRHGCAHSYVFILNSHVQNISIA